MAVYIKNHEFEDVLEVFTRFCERVGNIDQAARLTVAYYLRCANSNLDEVFKDD